MINQLIYRFMVGKIECIALLDTVTEYEVKALIENVNPVIAESGLAKYGLDKDGMFSSPYTCLLVNSGDKRVLVDTGMGDLWTPNGKLLDCLLEAGLKPEDIDMVIITHAHGDHVGGNTDKDGKIVFPNAQWVMAKDEWKFWSNLENLKDFPPFYLEVVKRKLLPLSDRLRLVEGETEVTRGIFIIPYTGHTPGHQVIAVRSEGEELLYISDAMLHPLHVDHPDWCAPHWADIDWEGVVRSRHALYHRAATNNSLVIAFHFNPFPALGHIIPTVEGWKWVQEDIK